MALLLSLTTLSCGPNHKGSSEQPPLAKRIPTTLEKHGTLRTDEYYWMNERDHPDVVAYLNAENEYTRKVMMNTEGLQKQLFDEIVARIKQTDMSVPYLANGYYYFTRYEEGREYPVYCRKKGTLEADEEVMINVNELAEGYSFYQVGTVAVSDDNRILAWSADTVSRRIYTIYFRDLISGKDFSDTIPNTSGNVAWSGDNQTVFYSVKDESLRPYRIYRHRLGTAPESDVLVYEEKDPTFNVWIFRTKSREYLVIGSSSTLSDECRILKADDPEGEFTVFQPRQHGLEYSIAHAGGRFFIRTNLDALNFRLMEAAPGHTTSVEWKEVIAHREDVFLDDFEVFEGFMALCERKDAKTHIRIITAAGEDYYMDFPEEAYTAGFENNPEFKTTMLRYSYTSLTTPNSILDFNTLDRSSNLLKQQEVMGGYDPLQYQTRRLYVLTSDSIRVPVSLVYRADMFQKGGNPLLLYGYGSYGASMDPYFSSVRLSLLDRGFVYAIAHVRGGQEMGRQWYDDGKLLKKKNTFTDFITCGEYLLEEGYAAPGKLYAMGGSAGGLLVGAVITMRPELFDAAIAAVPFVDVITTMLDESIPLTTAEYDEWGNPNIKEYFDYMLSYSPYDNVAPVSYPALLVTAGYHDSQVQYWEPAKWVAKMRVTGTGDRPLLLWTNMEYGHGGASGRLERYRETALEYAFLLSQALLVK